MKTPLTFNAKTQRLYSKLRARGPVNFTLAEFRGWLKHWARTSELWMCEYSREYLTIENVSIDHKLPLSLGGTGTLGNLAVCSEQVNRRKGSIPHDQFVALVKTVQETWPVPAQADLWRRLAARPAWGGRSRKSKAAQFVEEFNRK